MTAQGALAGLRPSREPQPYRTVRPTPGGGTVIIASADAMPTPRTIPSTPASDRLVAPRSEGDPSGPIQQAARAGARAVLMPVLPRPRLRRVVPLVPVDGQ